jgi:hypothetical protein
MAVELAVGFETGNDAPCTFIYAIDQFAKHGNYQVAHIQEPC